MRDSKKTTNLKKITISFYTLALMIFSNNVFAISDKNLVSTCLEKGKIKISDYAKEYNCKIDLDQIEVQEIDNRFYNPSKYIWYQVQQECNGYESIIKLVQYYKGKCI